MSRPLFCFLCAILGAGCATAMSPELRIAVTVQSFIKSADDFTSRRRAIAKTRQQLINETDASAARQRDEAANALAAWRIAGETESVRIYTTIVAESAASGATTEAYDQLLAKQAAALEGADTQVKLELGKLGDTVSALTALGSQGSFMDRAKLYLEYLKTTKAHVDALESQVSATGSRVGAQPSR